MFALGTVPGHLTHNETELFAQFALEFTELAGFVLDVPGCNVLFVFGVSSCRESITTLGYPQIDLFQLFWCVLHDCFLCDGFGFLLCQIGLMFLGL